MKSKTLSSSFTIFKKDITRFSPIWLLWSGMFLLMGYLIIDTNTDITLNYFSSLFTIASIIYGISCAVVLFGYLSDPRECVMLHSLPIRRENLFTVHLLAGLVMHLVPTALFCLCMIPSCSGSVLALFGVLVMQFVFFYGLGIFCVMLTGRRFAAVLVYGLINAAAPLLLFAVQTLYIHLLPGIELHVNSFMKFCPLMSMVFRDFFQSHMWSFAKDLDAYMQHLAVFAAIGLGLIALSLVLYRLRKLECAENFMAFPGLSFLFVPACTVFSGCFLTIFSYIPGAGSYWFLLILGGVTGYFASMMLLRHSPKVFDPKSLCGFALIVAVMAGSLFLTKLDFFGLVSRVPEVEQVARVEMFRYELDNSRYFTEDPEEISKLTKLHQDLIHQEPTENSMHVELLYHMKDGSTMKRVYEASEPLHPRIFWYFSQPEYQLNASSVEQVLTQFDKSTLYINMNPYPLNPQEQEQLLRALFADCKEAPLSFNGDYGDMYSATYEIELEHPVDRYNRYNRYSRIFSIHPEQTQTYAWILQYIKNHNITQ